MFAKAASEIVYFFMNLIGAFVYILPSEFKDFVAKFIADHIWFSLIPFRKKIILKNLAAVYPRKDEEGSDDFQFRCENMARKNAYHMILFIFEFFELPFWTRQTLNSKVEHEGLEKVRSYLDAGKGVFFLSAHMGPWELNARVAVLLGLKPKVVVKSFKSSFFDSLVSHIRKKSGIELLGERASGRAIIKSIKGASVVAFTSDQNTPGVNGVESVFFGMQAWSQKGIPVMASRLNAPVFPAFMLRTPHGYKFIFEKEFFLDPLPDDSDQKSVKLAEYANICNQHIEKMVAHAPEQYLWMHRRFKGSVNYDSALPWN